MSERSGLFSNYARTRGTLSGSLMLAIGVAALIISGNAFSRPASAQYGSSGEMNKVSATFSNPAAGYSITFPPGWSGFSFFGNEPIVIAGGINNKTVTSMNQSAAMMIIPVNRTILADLASLRSHVS